MLKRTPSPQIVMAVRSVYEGISQLGPTIAPKVFAQLKPHPLKAQHHHDQLSKRELEVLKLVGQGKNNQEIAQMLYLTEGTVKNYITQILNKLNVRSRTQAALWVQQHLLIDHQHPKH